MKNFICLGFNVDKANGYVTGLAVMHDLFISVLKKNGYKVKSISLNSESTTKGIIGVRDMGRFVEYFSIMKEVLLAFLCTRDAVFYFNPSTAKVGFYRDVLLVALAKLFGHKVLMQQFGALFESFRNSLGFFEKKLLLWSYNRANLIIVEGEYAKCQYSFIKDQSKIRVVQNGLPGSDGEVKICSKSYSRNESFNLFFMNNMIESKGYVDVLKAVDILVNQRNRNVTCTFAGRFLSLGDEEFFKNVEEAKKWFDDYLVRKNLTDRVKYFNCVFDEVKAGLFEKSHVFMLPSYYLFEGQPTAILEALSYGCVPIVTNYRLIPDMVNDECGCFVNKKSPKDIVAAVEKLMDNPDLYQKLSENGCIRFKKNFTLEVYTKKILKVIGSL